MFQLPETSFRRVCKALALLGMSGIAPVAFGAGLVVSPVRVELSSRQLTAMVTLENQGPVEETYQLEVTAWSQEAGQDRYTHTVDLIAVPRMFRLLPGRSQVVRIGLKQRTSLPEAQYRMFIQQLPGVQPENEVVPAVRTLLRVGIPVFVEASGSRPKPELRWSPIREGNRTVGFEVENPTTSHVQIGKIRIGGNHAGTVGFYVLPGKKRTWLSPEPLPELAKSFVVEAETDQGVIVYEGGSSAR